MQQRNVKHCACLHALLPACLLVFISCARARAQLLRASALFDDGQSLRGDGKLLILVLIVLAQCTPHASQDLRLLSHAHQPPHTHQHIRVIYARERPGREGAKGWGRWGRGTGGDEVGETVE